MCICHKIRASSQHFITRYSLTKSVYFIIRNFCVTLHTNTLNLSYDTSEFSTSEFVESLYSEIRDKHTPTPPKLFLHFRGSYRGNGQGTDREDRVESIVISSLKFKTGTG